MGFWRFILSRFGRSLRLQNAISPNGAIATLYNATEPDQLRGPQHDAAWCDELAKWRYARETWDMLQFGLRLGDDPRQVITTTPRPIPIVRDLLAREGQGVALTRGTTYDNRANLARNFFETIVKHYEGTRLGRQELNAELVDDVAGSLWTRAILDQHRVAGGNARPAFQRVVVGIDPAAKASADGDRTSETEIVVAGLGDDGRGYVLDDLSCRLSPRGWAAKAIAAFDRYQADALVVEINQGGAMVETVLRAERAGLPLRQVRRPSRRRSRARRAHRRVVRAGPGQPCGRLPGARGSDGAVHAVRHRGRRRGRPGGCAGLGAVGCFPAHGEAGPGCVLGG